MRATNTLKARGFDISFVARNAKGDVLHASLKRHILSFLDVPNNLSDDLKFSFLEKSASVAGVSIERHSFSYVKKYTRRRIAAWTGYSEKELWPYASATTLEKAWIEVARAEAGDLPTAEVEPLDPISPLPDLPPPADFATKPDVSVKVDTLIDADGNCRVTDVREIKSITLPPPTEPWMGDLHRLFSASPEATANAALRKRVAELEAQLAARAETDAATDGYYNGQPRVPHAAQMAKNEAAYLSQRTAELERLEAMIDPFPHSSPLMDEMAAWPPIYEERSPGPIRRFVNCLKAVAARIDYSGPLQRAVRRDLADRCESAARQGGAA